MDAVLTTEEEQDEEPDEAQREHGWVGVGQIFWAQSWLLKEPLLAYL